MSLRSVTGNSIIWVAPRNFIPHLHPFLIAIPFTNDKQLKFYQEH